MNILLKHYSTYYKSATARYLIMLTHTIKLRGLVKGSIWARDG